MKNGDYKLSVEKRISVLESQYENINAQVSNHIPTAIRDLDEKNNKAHEEITNKIDRFQWWLFVVAGGIATTLAVELIKNFSK